MGRRWTTFAAGLALIVICYLIQQLVARKYVVEAFHIRSAAMTPTLLPGDWILVDKRAYRTREPRRGEVVVYDADGERFTSRIVGMPGDRVELHDGALVVNGEKVREELAADRDGSAKDLHLAQESLAGVRFLVAREPGRPERELDEKVVEPGHYLVLSDFRNNAIDSRFRGTVDRTKLLGPVLPIYFSLDPAGGVRWSRIGRKVNGP